jgi:hypothetical protein
MPYPLKTRPMVKKRKNVSCRVYEKRKFTAKFKAKMILEAL